MENKKKILIADSDEPSLAYYRAIFKKHQIDTVNNGDEAIKKFIENDYDAVIVCSRLPAKDGLTVAKEIRALSNSIRIVMVSSNPDIGIEAINSGCSSFYLKPIINNRRLIELVLE